MPAEDLRIGAFYMPGWQKDSPFWRDLKGLPGSRSPGMPWPERKPLLGYYPEGEVWVAERHLEWASEAGLNFFVYNWYWLPGRGPYIEHALRAYLRSRNRKLLDFAIMWVNHPPFHRSAGEWRKICLYWRENFFSRPEYFRLEGRPLLLIFSPRKLRRELGGYRRVRRALAEMRRLSGGLFLVACLNRPPSYERLGLLALEGYDGVTAYNYVGYSGPRIDSYDNLISYYRRTWEAYARMIAEMNRFFAGKKAPDLERELLRLRGDRRKRRAVEDFLALRGSGHRLRYITPVVPGWDERPWKGEKAYVRYGSTPEKFARMLEQAKDFIHEHRKTGAVEEIVLIEAWNEFGEGAYIEPTVGWGKGYLEAVRKVFRAP